MDQISSFREGGFYYSPHDIVSTCTALLVRAHTKLSLQDHISRRSYESLLDVISECYSAFTDVLSWDNQTVAPPQQTPPMLNLHARSETERFATYVLNQSQQSEMTSDTRLAVILALQTVSHALERITYEI